MKTKADMKEEINKAHTDAVLEQNNSDKWRIFRMLVDKYEEEFKEKAIFVSSFAIKDKMRH